jgi:hypothetical protein
MSKKHVGSLLSVVTVGAMLGAVACSSGNGSTGFPESSGSGGSNGGNGSSNGGYTSSSGTGYGGSSSGTGYGNSSSGTGYGNSSSGTGYGNSSSGTGQSNSSSGPTTSSGGGSGGGPCTCTAPTSGGLTLSGSGGNYQSTVGNGGYVYSASDMTVSCVPALASGTACVCGNTGMQGAGSASSTTWGSEIGFNIGQAMATSSASPPNTPFTLSGAGITYTLTNLPTNARLVVDNAGTDYCFNLTAASVTTPIPWASFNTKCWDNSGTALSGAPSASHIVFQVVSSASMASNPFSFCVTSVSL